MGPAWPVTNRETYRVTGLHPPTNLDSLPWAGRLCDRHGGGVVAMWGTAAAVLTTVPFVAVDASTSWVVVQLLLFVRGLAIGFAAVPPTVAAYAAVSSDDLPDATTQVNILQRVGGALGGAVFAVIIADGVATSGPERAFSETFWWLTGSSVLALIFAVWLRATQRSGRGRSHRAAGHDRLAESAPAAIPRPPRLSRSRTVDDYRVNTPEHSANLPLPTQDRSGM